MKRDSRSIFIEARKEVPCLDHRAIVKVISEEINVDGGRH
jgi:hypothetical protein